LKYEIEESNKKWTAQTQASSESLKELSTVAGNNIATALKTLRSDVKEELQNLSNKGAMAVREVADEASAMVAASRFIVIGLLVLQIALDAYLIYKLW
jgi:gas vesicle protein